MTQDEAASPVIAVILMVAITSVILATLYLWVSGFGSGQTSGAQDWCGEQIRSAEEEGDYAKAAYYADMDRAECFQAYKRHHPEAAP